MAQEDFPTTSEELIDNTELFWQLNEFGAILDAKACKKYDHEISPKTTITTLNATAHPNNSQLVSFINNGIPVAYKLLTDYKMGKNQDGVFCGWVLSKEDDGNWRAAEMFAHHTIRPNKDRFTYDPTPLTKELVELVKLHTKGMMWAPKIDRGGAQKLPRIEQGMHKKCKRALKAAQKFVALSTHKSCSSAYTLRGFLPF